MSRTLRRRPLWARYPDAYDLTRDGLAALGYGWGSTPPSPRDPVHHGRDRKARSYLHEGPTRKWNCYSERVTGVGVRRTYKKINRRWWRRRPLPDND